jgi:transcriptional regulator with XRE-family HTH domain
VQNRIREFRHNAKLTQLQLSAKARIGLSRLQRLEAGIEPVRVDHAQRICLALGSTLEVIFPATLAIAEKFTHGNNSCWELLGDQEFREQLETAGMDTDPLQWTFKYHLRGGCEGLVEVSGKTKRRLWSAVHDAIGEVSEFVVFDGGGKRLALNLKYLDLCQFLFDRADTVTHKEDERGLQELQLFLADDREPHRFEVEPDYMKTEAIDIGMNHRSAQLQSLLTALKTGHDAEEFLGFEDFDGEVAFFRRDAVALVTVPLICVEPAVLAYSMN